MDADRINKDTIADSFDPELWKKVSIKVYEEIKDKDLFPQTKSRVYDQKEIEKLYATR